MTIYFIGPLSSTFVKNDIDILSSEHNLILESSNIGNGAKGILKLIYLIFKSFYYAIISDICYCWFADYATLAPTIIFRIFGKKVYVIAGGFDVGFIPELKYGARAKAFRWFCVKNTFRFANKIFPVSNFANDNLNKLTNGKHAPTLIIYNGVNLNYFNELDLKFERKFIMTVSQADNYIEYVRKGSGKFIELASNMEDYEFILAGLQGQAYNRAVNESIGIENIKIIKGPLNLYKELIPLYLQTSIYLQLSLEETFGVAIVEAMACGCVPIAADRTAMPEIIVSNDLLYNNDNQLIILIKEHYQYTEEKRLKIMEHSSKFDLSIRKNKIIAALIL